MQTRLRYETNSEWVWIWQLQRHSETTHISTQGLTVKCGLISLITVGDCVMRFVRFFWNYEKRGIVLSNSKYRYFESSWLNFNFYYYNKSIEYTIFWMDLQMNFLIPKCWTTILWMVLLSIIGGFRETISIPRASLLVWNFLRLLNIDIIQL